MPKFSLLDRSNTHTIPLAIGFVHARTHIQSAARAVDFIELSGIQAVRPDRHTYGRVCNGRARPSCGLYVACSSRARAYFVYNLALKYAQRPPSFSSFLLPFHLFSTQPTSDARTVALNELGERASCWMGANELKHGFGCEFMCVCVFFGAQFYDWVSSLAIARNYQCWVHASVHLEERSMSNMNAISVE